MALDHQISLAREALGVTTANDWGSIAPEEIIAVKGCGPETVNHLRIYLAARGLTLRHDQTPEYWQQHLSSSKIGAQLGSDDKLAVEPFKILIDTGEQHPWRFKGFNGSGNNRNRKVRIPTDFKYLGVSHGDYSIEGMEGQAHIERKSANDAIGTFLSTRGGSRYQAWIHTLEFLASLPISAVIIEFSEYRLANNIKPHGKRSKEALVNTFLHQVDAWRMDYGVHFIFCDSRRCAEEKALNILRRAWRKNCEQQQSKLKSSVDEIMGEF